MKHLYLLLAGGLILAPISGSAQHFLDNLPKGDSTQKVTLVPTQSGMEVPLDRNPFWTSAEGGLYCTTGLIWRDCNNDGSIDAFFSAGNDIYRVNNFIYLTFKGTLPPEASWTSTDRQRSGHCAVGDIDDNGYPDFAVSNFIDAYLGRMTMYLNPDGIPNRDPDWLSGDGLWSFSCALGDADNDGDLDLAVATGSEYVPDYESDRIYYNVDGMLEDLPSWMSKPLTAAMDVTWGDVDNDGDLDLAFAYDVTGAALYYNNAGQIKTSPDWEASPRQSANTLIFGDVNNDGWLDLIVAFNFQHTPGGYFRAYFNDGTGILDTLPGWQSSTAGFGSALALCDYDNDGDDDLAAGQWEVNPIFIYENTGSTFTTDPVWQPDTVTIVEELAWVDIDGFHCREIADTIYADDHRKLFYLRHHPLYSIDSVLVDGVVLGHPDYCYDLISGWISLAARPNDSVVAYYKYSTANDLTVANWDTHSMAFTNSANLVRPYADEPRVGYAPLPVQFYDSTYQAGDWLWEFGDGNSSDAKDPVHVYEQPGPFNVTLNVLLNEGWNQGGYANWIKVIADTLSGTDESGFAGGSIEMKISAVNNFPVDYFKVPVEFGGDLPLIYDSFSTAGCRTEYFAIQDYLHYDVFWSKRFTLRLRTALDGSQPEVEVGSGLIARLYFTIDPSAEEGQTTLVAIDGYEDFLPMFHGSLLGYEPWVNSGLVTWGCCEDIRGNVNGDSEEQIDVNDIIWFAEWLFSGGPESPCPPEADVNGDEQTDVQDLIYLVDYVFNSGSPPADCQ
ncbi:MAG: VCBS repeat-containing protein [Candidatus Zixiibacteriota bacterium]|nr:MAG: VCBS repeat-containing protein [candidate division Zixibacteria bacterium]